jgi:hypothetical protein
MMESASGWMSGALMVAAGAFHLTRLKSTCLNKCRSPLGFLMADWRPGAGGAFVMGLRHGAYGAGCCTLMILCWGDEPGLDRGAQPRRSGGQALPTEGIWPSRVLGAGLVIWGCLSAACRERLTPSLDPVPQPPAPAHGAST